MKNLKNKIKNLKGITLISLVVTIIILLILAGITISQLSNTGIFAKAKEARDKWQNAQDDEETQIGKMTNQIDGYVNSNRNENLENTKMRLILTATNNTNSNVGTYDISTFTNTQLTEEASNYILYDAENKCYKVKESGWYIFNIRNRVNQNNNWTCIKSTILINNEETIFVQAETSSSV